jgi:phenolic acid decarboxylase
MKAKRCLKRIEVWETVKTTFQTEVLPEDSLIGGRMPYTPTNEDSVDAVLIPRVWLEDKIEDKQEERDTCIRKEHMDWADYYRVQREAYEKYLLGRNAEFTVQKTMLDESVVETIEEIE